MNFFRKYSTHLKLLASLICILILYTQIDKDNAWNILKNSDLYLIGLAVLISAFSNLCGTFSWYWIIKSRIPGINFMQVMTPYWIGIFFNSMLPTNIGGDVIKGYNVIRKYGNRDFFISSIIVDRIINFAILGMIGMVAAFAAFEIYPLMYASIGLIAFSFMLVYFFSAPLAYYAIRFLRRFKKRAFLIILKHAFLQLHIFNKRKRGYYGSTLAAAFLSQFFKIWFYVYLIDSLSITLSKIYMFFIIPVLGFVSALPISIGGLGPREWVANLMAGRLGFVQAELVVLSFVGYLVFLAANSFGALFFIFDRDRKKKA